jgi:hypothetical protein
MRKPFAAAIVAAAVAAATLALTKPAGAGCWECWVVPGTSHAFMYGSIYGPYFAYPPYSEYGGAPYARIYYNGGPYGPNIYVHPHHHHAVHHD